MSRATVERGFGALVEAVIADHCRNPQPVVGEDVVAACRPPPTSTDNDTERNGDDGQDEVMRGLV